MTATDMERIEAQLKVIREIVERKLSLPKQLYTLTEAAERLGVRMTKMYELVAQRVVGTVPLGDSSMVPLSEIERLSRIDPPKMITPQQKRLAGSLAKLREPIPGAREAAIRVRDAKRPRPTQDLAALREMLKADAKKRRGR